MGYEKRNYGYIKRVVHTLSSVCNSFAHTGKRGDCPPVAYATGGGGTISGEADNRRSLWSPGPSSSFS